MNELLLRYRLALCWVATIASVDAWMVLTGRWVL